MFLIFFKQIITFKKSFVGKNIHTDMLSGIVVAIALIPEAIAFSLIAGLSPTVGLYTAFILGFVTALIGGKAGMISGATGAIAVVLIKLGLYLQGIIPADVIRAEMSSYILQHILLATIMAGVIQILIGIFKLGKLIRLVPQPAMYGFVNGLAIVIAMAQFPLFKGEGMVMYILVLATMITIYALPKFTDKVPAGLVAIIAVTTVVIIFQLNTKTIGDFADISGSLPHFSIPYFYITWRSIFIVLPYAFLVALVGLIESLLTLSLLDDMGGKRGSGNKECIAQGVGNLTCGFFGGMAGCAMIGQSIINFTNGGRGRLSSLIASILLIIFVWLLSDYISFIPLAVLVGIMFMVSINTFAWESGHRLKYMPNSDKLVLVIVMLVTIYADLAIAVICGIIISALAFAWKSSKVRARTRRNNVGVKIYEFDGPLFFGSTTSFLDLFDSRFDPEVVILDFKNSRVMDISGAEAIDTITKKYLNMGKKITIRHLSKDCEQLLKSAGPYCVYEETDPNYKVMMRENNTSLRKSL